MILAALRKAADGNGGVIFVTGAPGMGMRSLLGQVRREAKVDDHLSETRFLTGRSYPASAASNPYEPFSEALVGLGKGGDRKLVRSLLGILHDVAPELLAFVPGLGTALGAGVKAVTTLSERSLQMADANHASLGETVALGYSQAILAIARKHGPLALVIQDAQGIDGPSADLIHRLAEPAQSLPLVVLVTYRQHEVGSEHRLHKVRNELENENLAVTLELPGLAVDEILEYLRLRFGDEPRRDLAVWLRDQTGGYPYFIAQYLSVVEEGSSGRDSLTGKLAELPMPGRIEGVIRQRIEALRSDPDDRELLSVAAVQGRRFLARIVAANLELSDLREVVPWLEGLAETQGLVRRCDDEAWLASRSDVYEFEHTLLQRELYERLTPYSRERYHSLVASALEVLVAEKDPPRKLILELAQQCELARRFVEAARHRVAVAQTAFRQGALDEAAELSLHAIATLDSADDTDPKVDGVLTDAVELVMGAVATGWRGKLSDAEKDSLEQRGEAAATRTGDRGALARLRYMRGDREVQLRGLDSALKMLEEAVALAREAGDHVSELTALTALGHQTASRSLTEGVALLRQAHALGATIRASGDMGDKAWVLDRHLLLLRGLIGIGDFDTGDYGTALTELSAVVDELERREARWDIPLYCAFLAQVRTASGAFELSEGVLKRGITVLDEPNVQRAYCRTLLGKLYVEWERPDEAREPLLAGLAEAEALGHLAIVPLMRNYVGELYMDERFEHHDLDVAEKHLSNAVAEANQAGSWRGAVTALSLRARLLLKREKLKAALASSSEAVSMLEEYGDMPAVRAEEILYTHHRVLTACDEPAAAEYLTAAHDKLMAKAATLDGALRPDFLERVPVSRAILAARR